MKSETTDKEGDLCMQFKHHEVDTAITFLRFCYFLPCYLFTSLLLFKLRISNILKILRL